MELNKLLKEMEQHLFSSPDAIFGLGWRLRLWDVINKTFPDEAILRRGVLAFTVAKETLSAWDALKMPPELYELPRLLLRTCKRLLEHEVSLPDAVSLQEMTWPRIETIAGQFDEKGYALGACLAAFAALNCALSIEDAAYKEENVEYEGEPSLYAQVWIAEKHLQMTDEACFDWESWETHRWASLVAACTGQSAVGKAIDRNLLRQFWMNWLLEKVPVVLGSDINQIKGLLTEI